MTTDFNILLCGDNNVGKTAYMVRLLQGEFIRDYFPSIGENLHAFTATTEVGAIKINCVVTNNVNSTETFGLNIHGAIIMFDVTSKSSYANVSGWYKSVIAKHGDIPIILCGNKVDSKDRVVKTTVITKFHKSNNLMYIDLSVRSCYNFEKPFLVICRKLTNNWALNFIEFLM